MGVVGVVAGCFFKYVDDVVAVVEAVAVGVVGDVSIFLIIYHRVDMSEYVCEQL